MSSVTSEALAHSLLKPVSSRFLIGHSSLLYKLYSQILIVPGLFHINMWSAIEMLNSPLWNRIGAQGCFSDHICSLLQYYVYILRACVFKFVYRKFFRVDAVLSCGIKLILNRAFCTQACCTLCPAVVTGALSPENVRHWLLYGHLKKWKLICAELSLVWVSAGFVRVCLHSMRWPDKVNTDKHIYKDIRMMDLNTSQYGWIYTRHRHVAFIQSLISSIYHTEQHTCASLNMWQKTGSPVFVLHIYSYCTLEPLWGPEIMLLLKEMLLLFK